MGDIFHPVETEENGYKVYVEKNPDQYRSDYLWSVVGPDGEDDSGLEFTPELALEAAKIAARNMVKPDWGSKQ